MFRVQKLLIAFPVVCGCIFVSGCKTDKPETKIKTVAEYMHDIDAANARVHVAQTQNQAEAMQDKDAINASLAVANAMDPTYLDCWPKKPVITANTDHACLDSHGFVRK